MAYEKTIWKNREVERPRTLEKIENTDGTITLVPAEGNIIEQGTPIIAENMNKIEQGIKDAHDELSAHKADYEQHTPYAIVTGTDSYAVNINGVTSLVEGMSVKVKFTNANTGACTLNINGLSAKEIRKSNGNSLSAGNIKAGQICHLVYTGSVFQLLGEGGEYGTAQPEHVLNGYTIGIEEGIKSGTMPNRGAVIIMPSTTNQTILNGYHNGSGYVKGDANLIASNIAVNKTIFGVTGTHNSIDAPTAGDYVVLSNIDSGNTTSFSGWTKASKRIITNFTGSFRMELFFQGGLMYYSASLRIYKNGIFVPGTEYGVRSNQVTVNYDFSCVPGDYFELWVYTQPDDNYFNSLTWTIKALKIAQKAIDVTIQ